MWYDCLRDNVPPETNTCTREPTNLNKITIIKIWTVFIGEMLHNYFFYFTNNSWMVGDLTSNHVLQLKRNYDIDCVAICSHSNIVI